MSNQATGTVRVKVQSVDAREINNAYLWVVSCCEPELEGDPEGVICFYVHALEAATAWQLLVGQEVDLRICAG